MNRARFWINPPPMGVFGVNANVIVDVDETGMSLEESQRRYGYASQGERCVIRSKYVCY